MCQGSLSVIEEQIDQLGEYKMMQRKFIDPKRRVIDNYFMQFQEGNYSPHTCIICKCWRILDGILWFCVKAQLKSLPGGPIAIFLETARS